MAIKLAFQYSDMQCENIKLAFQCNLTNVATLHLGTHQSEFSVTEQAHLGGDYHAAVHDSGNIQNYTDYRTYFSKRLAYMIQLLRDTNDPEGGSLLDSTMLLQITCMGDGDAHDQDNAPFTMLVLRYKLNVGRSMFVPDIMICLILLSAAVEVQEEVAQYGKGSQVAGIFEIAIAGFFIDHLLAGVSALAFF